MLGDCYEIAGKYMMDHGRSGEWILVHAEVIGQGELESTPFGHAFLIHKASDMVHDYSNGRNIVYPKFLYYTLGKIEQTFVESKDGWKERQPQVYEYSYDDLLHWINETEHWGPWELETESGY
tara:strand:+ start:599 stop:967 length:369 start_codon:yes stop_codon:yes gene_type:complete